MLFFGVKDAWLISQDLVKQAGFDGNPPIFGDLLLAPVHVSEAEICTVGLSP